VAGALRRHRRQRHAGRAHGRDAADLTQFAGRTGHSEPLASEDLAGLEPDLAGRFSQGLYFREEDILTRGRHSRRWQRGSGSSGFPSASGSKPRRRFSPGGRWSICTGLAARRQLADLRGVKGEMLLLRLREVSLCRPVRLLHPRVPVYVVPRPDGLFMVGATMIESDEGTRISARSMLELLSAAYALHPAFGEAEIVEIGTGVRAAFADNLPRLRRYGETLYITACIGTASSSRRRSRAARRKCCCRAVISGANG